MKRPCVIYRIWNSFKEAYEEPADKDKQYFLIGFVKPDYDTLAVLETPERTIIVTNTEHIKFTD